MQLLARPTPAPSAEPKASPAAAASAAASASASAAAGEKAVGSGADASLVAMIVQLQAQVEAMGKRMEQQQETIRSLTTELKNRPATPQALTPPSAKKAVEGVAARPSKAAERTPPKQSAEALHSAVLAVTEEERLASRNKARRGQPTSNAPNRQSAMALEEDEEDEEEEEPMSPPLSVDRAGESEGASGGYISGRGAFGVDIYDEVPRIHYEPDDEDAAMLGERMTTTISARWV